MSDNAKRRLSIDLDEIERQLRQGGPAGGPAGGPGQTPAPKSDPLSELARIVGQDDPFGALLDEDQARRGRGGRNVQESDLYAQPAARASAPAPAARRAPETDPYARGVEADDPRAEYAARGFDVDDDGYIDDPDYREDYSEADYDDGLDHAQNDGYAAHDDAADWNGGADGYADEEEPPRRGAGRKSLITAAALMAVALVGVGSALWFAGSVEQTGGEPPLIAADSEPARVAPADPGGVQIPNQDTALLDRQDGGEVNVVDREEQPVDIAGLAAQPQAAQDAPRVVLPAPGAGAGNDDPIGRAIGEDGLGALSNGLEPPLVTSPAVAALGEPRRVRTVTVRPDGSIVGPGGLTPASQPVVPAVSASAEPPAQTAAQTAAVEPAPLEPIAVAPALPQGPASDDLPASALGQSAETAALTPVSAPAPVPPPAPARTSPPATTATAQPAPQPASGPLQLSALQSPAPAPAPSASAASGPTGGYAVQLAIRGSEGRAQEAFQQIQAQYASIIGDGQPIIRQAVVNGSTIYRVRVGAYSLERATQACDQIKTAGGDCFVAPNR